MMKVSSSAGRTLLAIMIVLMLLGSPVISVVKGENSHETQDSIISIPSPTAMALKNITRNEGVVVSASQIPDLEGTRVNNTDVKSEDNDILVYAWSNSTKEWRQIPFQVDEKITGSDGRPVYVGAADGVLNNLDEVVFMSGDTGDQAPMNAWVVGCDGPRYEIQVTDPLTGEVGWAYIYKSSTVEASFTEDYTSFDFSTNYISSRAYDIGFHDGNGLVVDEFRVTPTGGGDGTDLLDIFQMEATVTVLLATEVRDEDDFNNDFNLKKDGYVRSLGALSVHKHASQSGVTVDLYFNYTWLFYPDFVNTTGYMKIDLSGANSLDMWMGMDNNPAACPMNYTDSLGNSAVIDGNSDSLSNSDMERWWSVRGSHGGYVASWDMRDVDASSKALKYDDDSSYDESAHGNNGHAWADNQGHWGLAGVDMQSLNMNQLAWANMSLYPLPAGSYGDGSSIVLNENNPLQTTAIVQHSPAVWINKTGNKASVDSSDTIQYTIYFNNTGDRTAGHVWINDTLPPELNYVSDNASQSGGTKTGDYNWTFTDVEPGNHWFVINCTVDAVPGTYIKNTVHCDFNSSAGMMPSSEDNYTSHVRSPEISVEKIANKDSAVPGDDIQYTIYFNNTGETRAENVWINDTLPPELNYVSDNASQSGGTKTGDYNWTFTDVEPGNHWFVINCTVPDIQDATTAGNMVHLDYTAPGEYHMEPSVSWANVSLSKPIISVSVISNRSSAVAGDSIAYNVYFNNTGSAPASNVWINASLSSFITYVSDNASQSGGTKTGDYNWTFTDVEPGNHTFQINASVDGGNPDGSHLDVSVEMDYSTSGDYLYSDSAQTDSILEAPDIIVEKKANISFISPDDTPGQDIQYTIYFSNTGHSTAPTVWINDTLPPELNYVSDNASQSGGTKTGDYNWTFTDVAPGVHYFLINVSVNSAMADGDYINNSVSLEYKDASGVSMPASQDISSLPVVEGIKIIDMTSGNPSTGDSYNITANITGPYGVSGAYVYYWFELISGNTGASNESMSKSGDNYILSIDVPSEAVKLHYNISAVDSGGNWTETGERILDVQDNDPPAITDQSGMPRPGSEYNITADISDNIGVWGAWLEYNVSNSNGTYSSGNVSMNLSAPSTYWHVLNIGANATWVNYTIWANDTSNNMNHSSNSVFADGTPPSITDNSPSTATTGDSYTFSADVTDNIQVSAVYVEYWFGTGAHTNQSMSNTGGNTWEYTVTIPSDSTDTLHYIISARDSSGNWANTGQKDVSVTDNDPPVIVDNSPSSTTTGDSYTFSADVTDNIQVSAVYVEYWFGTGAHTNQSMSNTGGNTWEYTVDVPTDSTDSLEYTISAYDGSNWANSDVTTVTVRDDIPPTADAGEDIFITAGDTATFDASASTDNIGIVSYTWVFDDDGRVTLTGVNPTYTFNTAGDYEVTLEVSDEAGLSDEDTVVVHVAQGADVQAPSIEDATEGVPTTGDSFVVSALITDDVYVASASVDTWYETTTGNTDNSSLIMDRNGNTWTYTLHIPENALVLHYRFYASDNASNTNHSSEYHLNVLDNDAPTASFTIGGRVDGDVIEGREITLDASGSSDNVGIENYTWYINGTGTSMVLYGMNQRYSFSSTGTYEITLIVSDNAGNTGKTSQEIEVSSESSTELPGNSSGPFSWWWLIIAVILILGLIFLLAKRKKDEPEEENTDETEEEVEPEDEEVAATEEYAEEGESLGDESEEMS